MDNNGLPKSDENRETETDSIPAFFIGMLISIPTTFWLGNSYQTVRHMWRGSVTTMFVLAGLFMAYRVIKKVDKATMAKTRLADFMMAITMLIAGHSVGFGLSSIFIHVNN